MRRILLGILIVALTATVWLGWKAYAVYQGLEHITGVSQKREPGEKITALPPLNGNRRFNVLVLGSDNDKKIEESHPLTQSMIVVTVDPVHAKVTLLSIPRDFWVPIPGHGWNKIDVAAKLGGVPLARYTVEKAFGIPIHYYALVGLAGLTRVVDTFHGVDLDVSHPILDDYYPDDQRPGDPYAYTRVFIAAGWRHLSGRQALEYVRSRHADKIGDFGRSARQQQLLLALRKEADPLSVITNLPGLVDDLKGYVQTDLNIGQLVALAQLSRHIDSNTIQRVVLQAPTYCRYGFVGPQSVLFPDWAAIRPVVKRIFAPVQTVSAPLPKPVSRRNRPPPVHASPQPGKGRPYPARPTPTGTPLDLSALPGKLIFEKNGNVFQLSRSGSLQQLTTNNAIAMPAASSDGRRIAFVRFSTSYASDIWVLNRGSRQQPVPITNDANIADVHDNLWAAFPSWSSDGRQILFSSDLAKLPFAESESRQIDLAIYSMPAVGGLPTQLTYPPSGAGGDTDPQWRPGTSEFLYVEWNYNTRTNVPYSQIMLKNVNGNGQWALTPASGRVLQPQIDRSGKKIVYIRGNGDSSQVVVAEIRGSATAPRLGAETVVAQGRVAQPAFTPDARWVSYLQADGEGFSLDAVPSSGGAATRIDAVGSDMDSLSRPMWIP